MTTADLLRTEKDYLLAHREELAKQYPGRYLLIQGEKVFGAYETYDAGVRAGLRMSPFEPFLVRSVLHPEDQPMNIPALSLGLPL